MTKALLLATALLLTGLAQANAEVGEQSEGPRYFVTSIDHPALREGLYRATVKDKVTEETLTVLLHEDDVQEISEDGLVVKPGVNFWGI